MPVEQTQRAPGYAGIAPSPFWMAAAWRSPCIAEIMGQHAELGFKLDQIRFLAKKIHSPPRRIHVFGFRKSAASFQQGRQDIKIAVLGQQASIGQSPKVIGGSANVAVSVNIPLDEVAGPPQRGFQFRQFVQHGEKAAHDLRRIEGIGDAVRGAGRSVRSLA
jgi:hypothetical protein